MNIVNRGFLVISPKKDFLDWSNQYNEEIQYTMDDELEGTNFLIEEDFFDIDPIVEKHFKKMFTHELEMVTEDEAVWPEKLTLELFLSWFSVDYGALVIDLEKTDLKREKIE